MYDRMNAWELKLDSIQIRNKVHYNGRGQNEPFQQLAYNQARPWRWKY